MLSVVKHRRPISIIATLAFTWTILLFPALALAQTDQGTGPQAGEKSGEKEDYAQICSTAENDAKAHSSTGYAVGGFFCGVFGFAIAAVSSPKPPIEKIDGKSPEYVSAYTRCYADKAKKKNMGSACGGWALGAAASLLILTLTGGLGDSN